MSTVSLSSPGRRVTKEGISLGALSCGRGPGNVVHNWADEEDTRLFKNGQSRKVRKEGGGGRQTERERERDIHRITMIDLSY